MDEALAFPTRAARHRDLREQFGERLLRRALASGVVCQPWRGVVIRSDRALDLTTRASAAVLAVGADAVLSGPTAVGLHGCSAAEAADIHVTVPYSKSVRRRPGLTVHQMRFSPSDVVDIDGLPVLELHLALAEYLCTGDRRALASVDQAVLGLRDEAIADAKRKIAGRLRSRIDPRGVARALALTELATGKAESPPESFWRLMLAEAGFPLPEPQYPIRSMDGDIIYRLDMAWEEVRVALEHDGYAAHEARAEYDAERDRRLALRGWIVVHANAADLSAPGRVITELRAAFARRRR